MKIGFKKIDRKSAQKLTENGWWKIIKKSLLAIDKKKTGKKSLKIGLKIDHKID